MLISYRGLLKQCFFMIEWGVYVNVVDAAWETKWNMVKSLYQTKVNEKFNVQTSSLISSSDSQTSMDTSADFQTMLLSELYNTQSVNEPNNMGNSYSDTSTSSKYDALIMQAAQKYSVPSSLIKGVIKTESGFNTNAASSCNAQGLMQLMPNTASALGVSDSFDPEQNIDGGVKYLRQLLDKYDGNVELALTAYNHGPGNVSRLTQGNTASEKFDSLSADKQGYANKVLKNAKIYGYIQNV